MTNTEIQAIVTAVTAALSATGNNNSNTGSAVSELKESIQIIKDLKDGTAAGDRAVQKAKAEYDEKVQNLVSAGACQDEKAAKALLTAIGVEAPTKEYLDKIREDAEADEVDKNVEAFQSGLSMMSMINAAKDPIGAINAMGSLSNISNTFATQQTPPSTAPSRTYYTAREQYEDHRAITLANRDNKRGASAAERLDCNLNAFSEHLEVFARKFRR
jgi:hypothetical protein